MTRLTLITERAEHCGSIGGCAAYVSLIPKGETSASETRLSWVGERKVTQGLPAEIARGSYTVRFRSVLVSDDIVNGQPLDEFTDATCEVEIDVTEQHEVEITVVFRFGTCEASASYRSSSTRTDRSV